MKQLPRFIAFWARLLQEILSRPAVLIHCHDLDTLLPGLIAGRLKGVPVVLDAHESYYHMACSHFPPLIAKAIHLLERGFVPRTDAVIAACEATRQRYSGLGAKLAIRVGNWKALEDFNFEHTLLKEERRRLGLPTDDELVVGYIGYFSPNRGVLNLIEAVCAEEGVHLLLAGTGLQQKAIEERIRGEERIHYLGWLDPMMVPFYTCLADCIYYCYEPSTPFAPFNAPNKLYEALAAGRAVIASDIGGELSDVVRQTGCGVLVEKPSVEAIRQAIGQMKDRQLLARYQEAARRAALHEYNWARAEPNLFGLYEALLDGKELQL
jgi:glycosyltransferase involved in cell wall biosynthesis